MISCDDELRTLPIIQHLESCLGSIETFDFSENMDLLEKIASSDLAAKALKIALTKTLLNPDYQLPRFSMEALARGWTFAVTNHFSISVGVRHSKSISPGWADLTKIEQEPTSPSSLKIQPYPFDIFIKVMAVKELQVQRYVTIGSPASFDDISLEHAADVTLHAGDSMLLQAGKDVTLSKLQGTLVYLEITGPVLVPLLPQFDPQTRKMVGWISGDPTASRLELLTRTLAEFKYADSIKQVEALTQHRDHYVRWNSARHLLMISPDDGIRRVREAVSDAHPDVREVAKLTLEHLETMGIS